MTPDEIKQFHAARKEAGLKIDPQTAEVNCGYGQILDPYDIDENLPPEGAVHRTALLCLISRVWRLG